eukprot:CAMPEP_0169109214 /NCGR_PEP_ID=MMETSP1015-20121227/25846_1 /TAXON_ID=342587 /ORGANISM="Karlodinium micrum, Strain CCMP2283" /LENGTH=97 /DNA_ID=CAMNT_0009170897 /DNA_START=88 /DNA_END=381 /DNA_ORIENTATION=+
MQPSPATSQRSSDTSWQASGSLFSNMSGKYSMLPQDIAEKVNFPRPHIIALLTSNLPIGCLLPLTKVKGGLQTVAPNLVSPMGNFIAVLAGHGTACD